MRHVTTPEYGTEVVLTVGTGMQLVANGEDRDGTSHVRVCDPQGYEVAYWIEDEWRDEPALVMGAIIGALCSVEQGDPERGPTIGSEAAQEENLPRFSVQEAYDHYSLVYSADPMYQGDGPEGGVPVFGVMDEEAGGYIAFTTDQKAAETVVAALTEAQA